jgi:hypothetical protein
MRNTSGITVVSGHGRSEVIYNGQTMSLHYTMREGRIAARKLHMSMWPDDDAAQLDRWYGHDSR